MIKTRNINPNKSVYQTLFDTLKKNGFDVFPPATKRGECRKPYIVLKGSGSSQIEQFTSRVVYIRVLLYVPQNEFSKLDGYEKSVRKVIDEQVYPLVKFTGQTEPDFFDDNINGHLRAMLYQYNERDKYL